MDDYFPFSLGGMGTGVADPWSGVPYNVGSYSDPQASYYSSDPYEPSGEASSPASSYSQVPGTSGSPNETPSATPGGVSTGGGTGGRAIFVAAIGFGKAHTLATFPAFLAGAGQAV